MTRHPRPPTQLPRATAELARRGPWDLPPLLELLLVDAALPDEAARALIRAAGPLGTFTATRNRHLSADLWRQLYLATSGAARHALVNDRCLTADQRALILASGERSRYVLDYVLDQLDADELRTLTGRRLHEDTRAAVARQHTARLSGVGPHRPPAARPPVAATPAAGAVSATRADDWGPWAPAARAAHAAAVAAFLTSQLGVAEDCASRARWHTVGAATLAGFAGTLADLAATVDAIHVPVPLGQTG